MELVRKGAVSVRAEHILGAGSVEELEALLDDAMAKPELHDYTSAINKWFLPKLGTVFEQLMTPWQPEPEITSVLGAGPAAKLVEQLRLARVILSAIVQLLAARGPDAVAGLDAMRPADPLATLYDASIPVAVRECEHHGFRADVCGLVLLSAIARGAPLPPWLSLALVERLILGTRDRLRLIASIPGIAVPEDVVPLHERFDLQALEAEVLWQDAQAQEWMRAAEASGQEVYFPTGDPEHA
jgi:hypothetical protein